ncbi:plasmid recombination protein [uncultured Roseovarius sp.]|uniref:plasmid recombination protein n=1 Tax=uncultured Roseovarius sp. TaxID=293344 RepID=UPI002607592A|nr:plasmid recombination protein [uncultured Roseovarius sp.]
MTQKKHPLVFGMRSLWPGQLVRVEMHQTRTGGDLSHIRPGRTHLNQFLIGGPGWREQLEEDIDRASELNYRHAYSARRWTRKRKSEAQKIRRAGPVDPWKRDRAEGPLREGVLTANKVHFEGDTPGFPSVEKEDAFRRAAMKFLVDQFGESCVAAWSDSDEEAFHIHFVVAPWVVSESKQAGKQRRLEPSSIPVVKSYEAGHDIAAEYFKSAGLVRGEKRAQARRDAFAAEAESELPRENVPCHEWRADEAVRLYEKRKKAARAWQQARRKGAAAKQTQERVERMEAEARKARAETAAQARRDRQEREARAAEIAEREAALVDREEAAKSKEADLTRREKMMIEGANKFMEFGDAIRAAATKLGLGDHPIVAGGMRALQGMRDLVVADKKKDKAAR